MKRKLVITDNSGVFADLRGMDAKAILAPNQASIYEITSATPLSMIIYDLDMGPRLLSFIHSAFPQTPLVLLVDSVFEEYVDQMVDYLLVKPVNPSLYEDAIRIVLREDARVR